jgi:hypothetical protein
MVRSSSRWHVMHPLEWLKALYETFGTPYPRASLVVVAVLGAIFSAAVWVFAAKQVEKDHQVPSNPSRVSGPASTAGPQSPANTGNGNEFKYEQPSPPKEQTPPK